MGKCLTLGDLYGPYYTCSVRHQIETNISRTAGHLADLVNKYTVHCHTQHRAEIRKSCIVNALESKTSWELWLLHCTKFRLCPQRINCISLFIPSKVLLHCAFFSATGLAMLVQNKLLENCTV